MVGPPCVLGPRYGQLRADRRTGRGDLAARFHASVAFRDGRRWQLVATRANGQPAFGAYIRDPNGGPSHAMGLVVLTLASERISRITMFDKSTLPRFGFPRTLPG